MSSKNKPILAIRKLRFVGRGKMPRHSDRTCFHCGSVYTPHNARQKYCGSTMQRIGCSWIVYKAQKVQSRKRNRPKHREAQNKLARKYAKKYYEKQKAAGIFQTEEYKKKKRERQKKRYWDFKDSRDQAL